MGRVERTPQAVDDVIAIWEYVAIKDFSPDTADRLLQKFDEVLRLLSDQPEMGTRQDQLSTGLRSFSVGSFVIFYRPISDGVRLIRVLRGARRFEGLFDET